MSVQKSVFKAFNMMPETFYTSKLIEAVRIDINRPYVYDGTVLRKLRTLRSNGVLNYKCIDIKKSIYKKLEI